MNKARWTTAKLKKEGIEFVGERGGGGCTYEICLECLYFYPLHQQKNSANAGPRVIHDSTTQTNTPVDSAPP